MPEPPAANNGPPGSSPGGGGGGGAGPNLPWEQIVASAMDAIVTVDERGTIVMFNAAAERVFGVPAREAMGGSLERFLPGSTRGAHAHMIRQFGTTGVTTRAMGHLGTITGIRGDGTEFPMEASISQARVGERRYFSAILRDVSDRKRLEAQLAQAQKMECVGRLAGGIAHDFNNLLMAIFNYLTFASRRLGPDHPAASSLAQAHQAAQRAADLTRQLLTFSRKQAAAPRVVAVGEVIAGLVPMLERLIGEDVTLETKLAGDTGHVRADPAQLEQVLVNLVVNARDAMPHGGTVTIETRRETPNGDHPQHHPDAPAGERVVISVNDTGVGMTPEVRARLFEPFFTTKPPGKGTGLGLVTCHGIVQVSGGSIAVGSEPGKGTTVRVFLPRVAAREAHGATEPPRSPAPRGTETILVAEDSGLVRELVAEELRTFGYRVLAASSGAEALRAAREHDGPIDVLLTDVVMPGMSGAQLAEQMAAARPMPVIFMSGHTEETLSHHGVDPERVAFVAKPFAAETLRRLIQTVVKDARARG